tara:strand:+ start:128 stop:2098 length:1971 start_codon:yes stop_codon:yes gene_type:complete
VKSTKDKTSLLLTALVIWGFSVNTLKAQDSLGIAYKSASYSIKDPVSNIKLGGVFRFLTYVRDLPTIYPLAIPSYYTGPYPQQTLISVGTGYREPMLLLSISGTAKKNMTFGTELMLNSPFNGDFSNNSISLNLGTNFYSTLKSEFGNFKVHAGGISWYKQSKLTVWAEEGYLRYSLFERAPYDPLNKESVERYSKYYEQGVIDQDIRFSNVAFQGITISGSAFPWQMADGLSFQTILGKTQNNISKTLSDKADDYSFGFKISHKLDSKRMFGLNYFSSKTATDSMSLLKREFSMSSLEFDYKHNGMRLFGEIGYGSYQSSNVALSSGEAIVVNLATTKKQTLIPLQIQYCRISPEAVNVNASFKNTSVVDLVETTVIEEGANATVMTSFGGPITNLGYLANNRQGVSLNTEFEVGDFTISGGLGFYSEIKRINSNLSYNHISTGLLLSRISYFSTGYGPYGHLNSFYRGVYENVSVTDSSMIDSTGAPLFDKFFCSSDLHLKYKTTVFGKELYLFSLTNYNTAQDFFSATPVIKPTALIRQFNHRLDICYSLSKRVSLVLKSAYERVLANNSTELDNYDPFPIDATGQDLGIQNYIPSYKARNQTGQIFGLGFDIKLNDGAFLFLRHSQFKFNDKNYAETNIKGSETTLEIKINI